MIQVIDIKKVSVGNVRAFVNLKINDILIHDFRIVQQENQKPWVSVPQVSWKDREGKTHYKNLIELPKEVKEEVNRAILAHWN